MKYAPPKRNGRILGASHDLSNWKKLPSKRDVQSRLSTLQKMNNGKNIGELIAVVAEEIERCWQNQDMPVQSRHNIHRKIQRIRIQKHNQDNLFDILPLKPSFKSVEDRMYYECQKERKGYCTSKIVNYKIHPSRVVKDRVENMNEGINMETLSMDDESSKSESVTSHDSSEKSTDIHERVSLDLAVKLRQAANLSLSQTLMVLNVLYTETAQEIFMKPTRSALRKACYRSTKRAPVTLSDIRNDKLSFDGKTYTNLYGMKRHLLAICYDEKLIALRELPNKTSETVSDVIISVLQKNELTPKVCISDTEPTNTGRTKGVIVQMQKSYPSIVYEPCRLHLLNLILKHEIMTYFPSSTTSPNLQIPFVAQLFSNWRFYKAQYENQATVQIPDNICASLPQLEERRSDYKLLLQLVLALKYKRSSGLNPKIVLPNSPPSIIQSRWNSRAIYSILAELVLMDNRKTSDLNTFIVDIWAIAWFSARQFIDWHSIFQACTCEKSKNVIRRNIKDYADSNPYTNETAERVFRMIEEKKNHCQSIRNLELTMIQYFNDPSARLTLMNK
jgi:hypothetical protein